MRFGPMLHAALTAIAIACAVDVAAYAEEAAVFRHGDWPFRPPQRPVLPQTADTDWAVSAIDRFILARLEKAGLRPSPQADKLTLLRRVSFDLTGLPPTPDEQDAFLADDRPGAYERLVDRLLASPAFGERAAQFWLDLVRYAETDGFKADDLRPNAHKYRDFVIRAFNDDLPYDRFVSWQLAGDELEPNNLLALAAAGYSRLYPDEYNAANLEQRRQEILDDITGTTSLAFLGLTMGCAQCHDHKYDEIAQADYFRLQAFFAPLVPHEVPDASPEDLARYQSQLAEWEGATAEIRGEIEKLIGTKRLEQRQYLLGKFRAEIRQAVALPVEQRTPYQEQIARMALKQAEPKDADLVKKLPKEEKERYAELQARLKEFDHLRPIPPGTLMTVSDVGRTAPNTWLLEGGAWQKPAEELSPGFPEFLGEASAAVCTPPSGSPTTGRRSALASWLTRPDHPLTARVMVNRLWQQHFGVGIVASANDFGVQGDPPTHPELLDWLSVELVEHGWSLKHLHRLMVTSAAYRQASKVETCGAGVPPAVDSDSVSSSRGERAGRLHHNAARERDPQNYLLWHARRRRLEGEAIRDAMLTVSGELNSRMFGASARPELPEGLSKSYAWAADEQVGDRRRRSVYVFAKRNLHYPLFEAFDQPDMHHSCPRRTQTTTAPQSLLLLNGELASEQARAWAARLRSQHGSDLPALVNAAYRQAFARTAAADEIQAAAEFINAHNESDAVADFCHALINANEFIYVD